MIDTTVGTTSAVHNGYQYNARVDYTHGQDLFAVSFYITPLNSFAGDTGANGRPMADLTFNPRKLRACFAP